MHNFNVRMLAIGDLEQAARAIAAVGADDQGQRIMKLKSVFRVLRVSGLSFRAANILKQELLAAGGDAAVHRDVVKCQEGATEAVLMATLKHYRQLVKKLRMQPFGLAELGQQIEQVLSALEQPRERRLSCGQRELVLGNRTLVMGILNITPDSFSDGGKFSNLQQAIHHAHKMVEDGADIIDVGAESTRPGANSVAAGEELDRLLPVLDQLVKELPAPISVDTYKEEVARAAVEHGAQLLNDIWGLKQDPGIARVAAQYGIPLVLMHNQRGNQYQDLIGDIIASLRSSVAIALEAGMTEEQIILDPGVGFGKDTDQNLAVLRHLREFRSLGFPLLLGTSRKSVIGNTLELPVDERVEGTAATVALGIAAGVEIMRVHDVKAMVRVIRMSDAVVRGQG